MMNQQPLLRRVGARLLPPAYLDRLWIARETVRMRPGLSAAALVMVLLSAAVPLALGTVQYTPGDVAAALVEKAPLWLQTVGSTVILAGFHWWLALALLATWLWATSTGRREIINTSAVAGRITRAVRRSGYLR